MTRDVFISYSSIDKDAADSICAVLEQNSISCWMAPRDITPGREFAVAIIDGIRSSKIFVLVYTSNSNISSQVKREVDRAVHHGLTIITFRLEDVPLSKQLEYYLSSVHWIDAITPTLKEHVERLSGIVKALLNDDVKDEESEIEIGNGTLRPGKDSGKLASPGKDPLKKMVIPAVISGVLLLIALLIVMPLLRQNFSTEKQEINKSIAVLPFTNLSNDPEQEYFSDGMMEEILDRLFRIGDLRVISRTSSMRYKNSDLSMKEIARELGVASIVEGSVRKIGNKVRITVQLIDAVTDSHLWSAVYDRNLSDIFAVQSEIAQNIAVELQAVITPQEKVLLEKPHTASSEAYEAYLKGMHSWNRLTPTDIDIAMKYFELALTKDPGFALAWAGVAHVWTARRQFDMTPPAEATAKGDEAILKALELDSTNAEIFYIQACHLVWGKFDWKGGETAFRKALEINPKHAEALAYYSHLLNILGRTDEAMIRIEKALEIDPFSSLIWALYSVDLTFGRRYEEAIRASERSLELDSAQQVGFGIGNMLYYSGKEEEAFSRWRKNFTTPDIIKTVEEGYTAGGFREAHRRLAGIQVERSGNNYIPPFQIANNYSIAGDTDNAVYWLEKAYEMRDPNMAYLLLPYFDLLREDPRFRELCRRMNLPYR